MNILSFQVNPIRKMPIPNEGNKSKLAQMVFSNFWLSINNFTVAIVGMEIMYSYI